jgi:hypothetical protein
MYRFHRSASQAYSADDHPNNTAAAAAITITAIQMRLINISSFTQPADVTDRQNPEALLSEVEQARKRTAILSEGPLIWASSCQAQENIRQIT